GCILYEMVCGQPPFVRAGTGALIKAHVDESPTPPSSLVHRVPAKLEALILRALAKQPHKRQQSMEILAQQLDALLSTTQGNNLRLAFSPRRRILRAPILATGLLIAASAALGFMTFGERSQSRDLGSHKDVFPATAPTIAASTNRHRPVAQLFAGS